MGNLIKVTGKAFLREHPFIDPDAQPTPVQKHSFIFPGDEIVFYHDLDLPGDAGAASISQVQLISMELSLIAQKPQVFSEEFSEQFKSTRNFKLDNFIATFNNANAPIIPWGADGYAPYVTLLQDRNWRLPPGDFRRQIKLMTKHTAATTNWTYRFMWPVLFRWEYWKALLGVNNDFYNPVEPQNGQNNWWYHYFVLNKWIIKSRLDLYVKVLGVNKKIRSELNLTPGTIDVNDYESSVDWGTLSIKTSAVGGAPSNTPCLINGNRDTEVWAYFEKKTPFDINEQGEISGVMWVEPYLGAGRDARTRASSLYQITPESVFAGLNTSITDDSGTGITDALGNYIVTDSNGVGVKILFDGIVPEKVVMFGIIDFNKLANAWPGEKKFSIKARLYDSMIDAGETKQGEEIMQDAILISTFDLNTLCEPTRPMCPFELKVYADLADSSFIKNDKSDFYQFANGLFADVSFVLQKNNSTCGDDWEDVAAISETKDNEMDMTGISQSDYGRYFAFGTNPDFSGAAFEDDNGQKYTGLFLEWRKVLAAFGIGTYRMKTVKVDVFGNITSTYDERIFCLRAYNCNLANRTIKIETLNEGMRGSFTNRMVQIDYAGGWRGEIRLKGVMKYTGSGYVKEFNQYNDTKFNAFKPTINEQLPKFTLSIRPIPGWMDWILSTDVLQADEIKVTDFNTNNRHTNSFVRVPVMNDGDYTPRDNELRNPLSDVDIKFAYGLNNLRKRNSQ